MQTLAVGSTPTKALLKEEQVLVSQEVQKLVLKQAIKEVREVPNLFLSQLFLVLKKDGSQRPVVNLKAHNLFINKQKFKMEGTRVIKDLL